MTVNPAPPGSIPDLIYSTPSDNPTAPGDIFTPSVVSFVPASNCPVISVLTESGIPGDTLVASGDQFNSDIKLTFYGQTTSGNGTTIDGTQKRLVTASNLLASRIDAAQIANSMYLAWPVNSNGTGYPVAVNKTELWWVGVSRNATSFDQSGFGLTQQSLSVIGDTCRIHGRNLANLATPGTSHIYWKPVGAAGQFITPSFADPFCVEFTVPSGISPAASATSYTMATGTSKSFTTQALLGYTAGMTLLFVPNAFMTSSGGTMQATVVSYSGTTLIVDITAVSISFGTGANVNNWFIFPQFEIWCHNGHGGVRGWSGPLTTALVQAETYLGGSGTNSVTLGAPTGGDDAGLFNTAIAALGAGGGGTINVPAGTYILNTKPNSFTSGGGAGIWLKGASTATTIINVGATFNDTTCLNLTRCSKISDMTINVAVGATCEFTLTSPWVENVNIVSLLNACVNGSHYLSGCDLAGGGDNSSVAGNVRPAATDTTILSCTFRLTNSVEGAVYSVSQQRMHFADSTVQDYDVNGAAIVRGVGRIWVGQLGAAALHIHQYFSRNTTVTLAPPLVGVDQNKGEQFLWDGGDEGVQSSLVASATSNSITYVDTKSHGYPYTDATIFIVAGKGLMQRAVVIGENSKTLTLDRDFKVIPDTTSRVNITFGASRLVIYNNVQQGNNNYRALGSTPTASQGFQTNGGADVIYKDNTLSNGFQYAWTLFNGANTESCIVPLYGFLIEGNTVTTTKNGARLFDEDPIASEAFTTCGCIQRRNTLTGCIDSCFALVAGGAVDMCIWENNTSSDAVRGLYQYFTVTSPHFMKVQVYDSAFSLGTGTFSGSKAKDIFSAAVTVDEQPASGQFTGYEA